MVWSAGEKYTHAAAKPYGDYALILKGKENVSE
jgi:hypothetical protein